MRLLAFSCGAVVDVTCEKHGDVFDWMDRAAMHRHRDCTISVPLPPQELGEQLELFDDQVG